MTWTHVVSHAPPSPKVCILALVPWSQTTPHRQHPCPHVAPNDGDGGVRAQPPKDRGNDIHLVQR